MAKTKFPPLSPLAETIKDTLNKTLDSPREGIVTGVTISSVILEQLFKDEMKNKLDEVLRMYTSDGNPDVWFDKIIKLKNQI